MIRTACTSLLIVTVAVLGAVAARAAGTRWPGGASIEPPATLTAAADWDGFSARRWAGPNIWCNRLQDWEATDGALTCKTEPRLPARTAHLLTYELADRYEPFQLTVILVMGGTRSDGDFAGFLIGAGQGRLDYRGAAIIHHLPGKGGGILAVREADGRLVFRDMSAETNAADYPLLDGQRTVVRGNPINGPVKLFVEGVPAGGGRYDLRLSAWKEADNTLLAAAELRGVDPARLLGNVALISNRATDDAADTFRSFAVGGRRLVHHPERTYGPIAGVLYSVARNTLKLGAQFMSLGVRRSVAMPGARRGPEAEFRMVATLEQQMPSGEWELIDGPRAITGPDFNVPFRVENWDANKATKTRVTFRDVTGEEYHFGAEITADPVGKETVSVAGFTGMGVMGRTAYMVGPEPDPGEFVVGRWTPANVWMPFAESVEAVRNQNVDYLFFTGDQVYEGKPSPKDMSFQPEEDYLYKWLLWHWSFRNLTNHLPASVQPDDHDVYHGNLWGWGGRLNLTGFNGGGGYLCSPQFVNMVHKTQSGHLPDPYDPKPVRNGITNYYTNFAWGGVGFAVLEDRKFKSPGHIEDPAEQTLLGEDQERMLHEWGEDWTGQEVKCVVSQTIYAAMHVGFDGQLSDDRDTNGFPKSRRDEAVRLFRRCGAFVLSGDQHLSTYGRLGVEAPSDGVYQFAVPALGNIFWRWFYPNSPGTDRAPGDPDFTGEFVDGLGNYFRMIAVANPERRSLLSQRLRQRYLIPEEEARNGLGDENRTSRGDGYGVLRFNKHERTITVECWPYNAHLDNGGKPFDGWPTTVSFDDLDGRKPVAWLPTLDLRDFPGAVVQTIDESTGETVKITRADGDSHAPPVFDSSHTYTLRVGEPNEKGTWWTRRSLKPSQRQSGELLPVK